MALKAQAEDAFDLTGPDVQNRDGICLLQGDICHIAADGDILWLQVDRRRSVLLQDDACVYHLVPPGIEGVKGDRDGVFGGRVNNDRDAALRVHGVRGRIALARLALVRRQNRGSVLTENHHIRLHTGNGHAGVGQASVLMAVEKQHAPGLGIIRVLHGGCQGFAVRRNGNRGEVPVHKAASGVFGQLRRLQMGSGQGGNGGPVFQIPHVDAVQRALHTVYRIGKAVHGVVRGDLRRAAVGALCAGVIPGDELGPYCGGIVEESGILLIAGPDRRINRLRDHRRAACMIALLG